MEEDDVMDSEAENYSATPLASSAALPMYRHEEPAEPITIRVPAEDVARAKRYGRAARSPRTRVEYARDWADFIRYCEAAMLASLPADPQTVAAYLASLAGRTAQPLKETTIQRRAAAIAFMHRQHGVAPPTAHPLVADVLAGITREHGMAPQRKTALTIEMLREVLAVLDDASLRDIRDRAILLIGFAAALRRAELVALNGDDLEFDARGVTVHIRSSKTDQEQRGEAAAIPDGPDPTCYAVRAVERWISEARLNFDLCGPLFRSFARPPGGVIGLDMLQTRRLTPGDIARVVHRVTEAAGLAGDFGAHSLRAGFITSAAIHGVAESNI